MVNVVSRVVPRPKPEAIGHYTGLGQRILIELNPNILVRDAIRMSIAASEEVTCSL